MSVFILSTARSTSKFGNEKKYSEKSTTISNPNGPLLNSVKRSPTRQSLPNNRSIALLYVPQGPVSLSKDRSKSISVMYRVICVTLMQRQGVFIKFCIFRSELGALGLLFLILNLTTTWVIHLNVAER